MDYFGSDALHDKLGEIDWPTRRFCFLFYSSKALQINEIITIQKWLIGWTLFFIEKKDFFFTFCEFQSVNDVIDSIIHHVLPFFIRKWRNNDDDDENYKI